MPNMLHFKQKNIMTLEKPDQVKAYMHPIRMKILSSLMEEKKTVSIVAKDFGVHPANINHHFKLLNETGLICLVEKRDAGRNLEKYYQTTARQFDILPQQKVFEKEEAYALSLSRDDLTHAIHNLPESSHGVTVLLEKARIKATDFDQFRNKLLSLLGEFRQKGSDDGTSYHLNLSLYPSEKEYGPAGTIRLKFKNQVSKEGNDD